MICFGFSISIDIRGSIKKNHAWFVVVTVVEPKTWLFPLKMVKSAKVTSCRPIVYMCYAMLTFFSYAHTYRKLYCLVTKLTFLTLATAATAATSMAAIRKIGRSNTNYYHCEHVSYDLVGKPLVCMNEIGMIDFGNNDLGWGLHWRHSIHFSFNNSKTIRFNRQTKLKTFLRKKHFFSSPKKQIMSKTSKCFFLYREI